MEVTTMEQLKPCPFCGTALSEFPEIMVNRPVRSEEYLTEKLKHGHFLGTDNWFHVVCNVWVKWTAWIGQGTGGEMLEQEVEQ